MSQASLFTLFVLLVSPLAHGANNELPSNVTVRSADSRNSYLDTIDFSYQPAAPVSFSKLKLCVAESLTNNSVALNDASGSIVGSATGTYYSDNNNQTVQGGGIFKYVDDSLATLIASGTTDGGKPGWGLSSDFVKFELKASTSDSGVLLKVSNITRAQQSTGLLANDGFQPVGTWKGAGAMRIYEALKVVTGKVESCAQ